ncbi:hypothetical protein GCM10022402_30810 [Salinactinospora qingdaonensis]|uniref:Uncharacterized protein n=1 Tax=Salinactinospora qingdaonensis TaxID=702744 RepID=A0ABP7FWY5_9ACTN
MGGILCEAGNGQWHVRKSFPRSDGVLFLGKGGEDRRWVTWVSASAVAPAGWRDRAAIEARADDDPPPQSFEKQNLDR